MNKRWIKIRLIVYRILTTFTFLPKKLRQKIAIKSYCLSVVLSGQAARELINAINKSVEELSIIDKPAAKIFFSKEYYNPGRTK